MYTFNEESKFEIEIVLIAKIEQLTKQIYFLAQTKLRKMNYQNASLKTIFFIVAPFMRKTKVFAYDWWSQKKKHWSFFDLSDLQYIWDQFLAAINPLWSFRSRRNLTNRLLLILQPRDIVAFSFKRKSHVDPGTELVVSLFPLLHL